MLISISLSFSLFALVMSLAALGLAEQRRRELTRVVDAFLQHQRSTVECFDALRGIDIENQAKIIQAIARETTPLITRLNELESSLLNVQKFVQ